MKIMLGAALFGATVLMAQDATKLAEDPTVKAALEAVKRNEPHFIEEQARFCQIPAPPFKEQIRGQEFERLFKALGLENVRIDKAGNVIGVRPGAAPHPNLVFAAHLDTVFPPETDVKVTREGTVLNGPGIGDDCRGLAVMLGVIQALKDANVKTPGTITFVADTGEEGLGDLRGTKNLFADSLKGQIDKFISVDGTGLNITNIGVGSYRYRVTFQRTRRAQFRSVRHSESDSSDGPRNREDRRLRRAQHPENHLQRRSRGRRNIGECDSLRGVDGGRYAILR